VGRQQAWSAIKLADTPPSLNKCGPFGYGGNAPDRFGRRPKSLGKPAPLSAKPIIAVIFGGPTIEHDVSVLTGLQILDAIDATRFDTLAVYIDLEGAWWVGDALRARKSYLPDEKIRRGLTRVHLPLGRAGSGGRAELVANASGGLLARGAKSFPFDVAIPSIHGTFGEDGVLQGAFEAADVPYVGCGVLAASVLMNKSIAKRFFQSLGIPVLKAETVRRPQGQGFVDLKSLAAGVSLPYPLCIKPNDLGSSVGVSAARSASDLEAGLASVFRLDETAIVEPLVPNLVEYNVAVTRALGGTRTSAIERPLRKDELLDFRDKYLSGGDMDTKLSVPFAQGMASATREIDPKGLNAQQAASLRAWASELFEALDLRGVARADFLCNGATGELWLNEFNTFPGSLAYFLWEAVGVNFTELLSALIDEALLVHGAKLKSVDPASAGAAIFKRG
jgi:D-alanine-D-alanine ligase